MVDRCADDFCFHISIWLRHDINEVIDCMMDALTNEQPKADYIPDVGSRIVACVLEMLPIYWADRFILLRK